MNTQDKIKQRLETAARRSPTADNSYETPPDVMGIFWHEYRKSAVPADARPVQLKLTEEAFYAGAYAALQALSVTSELVPAEDVAARLEDECRPFWEAGSK